jgi:hypothetical protein
VKQFIKNALPTFDEHRYGFHSFLEAVRSGQRAGLFRLERNRQGILRVYPGNQISQLQRGGISRSEESPLPGPMGKPYDVEDDITLQPATSEPTSVPSEETAVEAQPELETSAVEEVEAPSTVVEEDAEKPTRKRRVVSGIKRKTVTPRKTAGGAPKRPRKKSSTPPEEVPS